MMIANGNGFVVLLLFLILSGCCIPGSAKPGEKNLSRESVSKMEKQMDKATKNIDKAMKNLDKALQKYFESGGAAFCIHGECEADEDDYVCSCEPGYTGQKCETDIDECASQPCIKSTICIDRVNGYDCACASDVAPVMQQDGIFSFESVAAPGKYLSFDPERGDDAVKFVDGVDKFRIILPADPCTPSNSIIRFQMISDATVLDANVWVMQRNGTAGARFGLATGDNINPDYYTFPFFTTITERIQPGDGSQVTAYISQAIDSQPPRYLTYQDDGLYWLEDNGNESTRQFKVTIYASP